VTAAGQGRPQAAPGTWSPAAADLTAFAGTYYSPELETTYSLRVENGKLLLVRRRESALELAPTSSDTFGSRGLQFRFTRDKGKLNGFTVDAGRTKNLRFDRTK